MEFVEQLKSSLDIVSVVGEYVRLEKRGPRYVGLCPFHTEKTPSFGVHASHQFYKCFGCGAGGDVLSFVMQIEGISFYEALKHLAERHGIPMPKRTRISDPESRQRDALHEMHELAASFYRSALQSAAGAAAREYLAHRRVPDAIQERFGLGYADSSGHALADRLKRAGISPEDCETGGLLIRRHDGSGYFDRFRGRLMFPIHNESGRIIAFAGRILASGDEAKYMNSPETPIYRKSAVLYNLHRARKTIRKTDCGILVEGYMDVIGLDMAGVEEAVASCGTALTNQQVRALRRHSERIVVNFDPDAAGAAATERSIQMLLEEGMHIRVLELDEGTDPDEYVRKFGPDQYRARLKDAAGYFYWLADRARSRHNMRNAEGKMEGLKSLLPAIQKIPDKLERAAIANDVAGYLGVEPGLVLEQFRRAATVRNEKPLTQQTDPLPAVERILVTVLLSNPDARRDILPRLKVLQTARPLRTRGIVDGISRLQETHEYFSYAALQERLDEQDRSLLATIAFGDASEAHEGYSMAQAVACLRALEQKEHEDRIGELRFRVKEAEREGRLEDALKLIGEMSQISENNGPRRS